MIAQRRRIVAIIQARMGSERLPGKVLASIVGKPMLEHVVDRATRVESVDEVVVATTTEPADDPIAVWGSEKGRHVYRGHPTDVLDRYYRTAVEFGAEVVVRLTGDCPMLDPAVTERTIAHFLTADPTLDFAANRLPGYRTYPIGLDTEVCTMAALESAWKEAKELHQREHVMPYLYQEMKFAIGLIGAEADYGHERWTVDTPEDLEFVRAVFEAFDPPHNFSWRQVLSLLEGKPELKKINQDVRHRTLEETDSRVRSTEEMVDQR